MKITKFIMPVVTIIAVIVAVSFYVKLDKIQSNPQIKSQDEINNLVDKVSKLVVLPTEEKPTIGVVSNPDELKDKAFFLGAKKGDVVFMYESIKKAVLYSISEDKIINIAPLDTSNSMVSEKVVDTNKTTTTSTSTTNN